MLDLLCETQPQINFQVIQIYAHRGARAYFPENTLIAFEYALTLGVHFIDADVVVSREGELIVYHDTHLNCDITQEDGSFISKLIPIEGLSVAQLKRYNVGMINQASSYATFFPDQHQCDAQIPTLVEVINLLPSNVNLQIELKCEMLSEKLLPLLARTSMTHRVEVQSFHWDILEQIHKRDRMIKTAFLTAHQTNVDFKEICKRGGKIWGPFEMDVTQELVERAHAHGLKVVPWGWPEKEGSIFNKSCLENLIRWGVDGIITDAPALVQNLILKCMQDT